MISAPSAVPPTARQPDSPTVRQSNCNPRRETPCTQAGRRIPRGTARCAARETTGMGTSKVHRFMVRSCRTRSSTHWQVAVLGHTHFGRSACGPRLPSRSATATRGSPYRLCSSTTRQVIPSLASHGTPYVVRISVPRGHLSRCDRGHGASRFVLREEKSS
ncbi:hypothetical protein L227DRAFT_98682 [Lentinus tigrinus ALCF2SS1-6]|uniref:Uncharacterized protein n=1 Tax=Lentinus tigrinus ALCF2SS1-6 TaxID=1328759 RepID=A0A5C2SG46_9APHY|nr:hypothetical protein L227DRAFT_98682 [Lentinus tigrinus ALCF2SS1-6]